MPLPNRHHSISRPAAACVAAAAAVSLAAITLGGCGSSSPGAPPTTVRVANFAAAAVNPVTVSPLPGTSDASPTTQISFLGGPGTTVSDVQVVRLQQRQPHGQARGLLDRDGREFPARQAVRGRRDGESQRRSDAGRDDRHGSNKLRHRLRGSRESSAVSARERRSGRRPALPVGPIDHALDGDDHDAGAPGRNPRRLLPRALSGRRALPGQMIVEPGRPADLVSPDPARRVIDQLPPADLRRTHRPDVVAGTSPRARLRPGRG